MPTTQTDTDTESEPVLKPTHTSVSNTSNYTCSEAIDLLGFGPFHQRLVVLLGLFWLSDAMEFWIRSTC